MRHEEVPLLNSATTERSYSDDVTHVERSYSDYKTVFRSKRSESNNKIPGVISGIIFACVLCVHMFSSSRMNSIKQYEVLAESPQMQTTPWYMYKFARSISGGTGSDVLSFVDKYICPKMSAPVDLGCGGLKVGCSYKSTFVRDETSTEVMNNDQLHWVDSPNLFGSDIVSDWEEYFATLHGDMMNFNGFMHDKVQLYVEPLNVFVADLENGSIPFMKRSSLIDDGYGVLVTLAHISVVVAGRIVELVGPMETLDDDTGFDFWKDEECPESHQLTSGNLSSYKRYFNRKASTAWSKPEPMLVSIHIADPGKGSQDLLVEHIMSISSGAVSKQPNPGCDITTFKWPSMEGTDVKYITNYMASTGSRTFQDYSDMVSDVHQRFTAQVSSSDSNHIWSSWDNYLDQHVGMQYSDSSSCMTVDKAVADMIMSAQLPVGGRKVLSNNSHYYTGYNGSVTWEWNMENCRHMDLVEICTCSKSNNADEYKKETGLDCS